MRTSNATASEAHASHELAVEVRGPKAVRHQLWLLLLRVQELVEKLLEDFPGVTPDGVAYCPGCAADPAHCAAATSWKLDDASSRRLKCERCKEEFAMQAVKLEPAETPAPLALGLHVTPPPFKVADAPEGGGGGGPEGVGAGADGGEREASHATERGSQQPAGPEEGVASPSRRPSLRGRPQEGAPEAAAAAASNPTPPAELRRRTSMSSMLAAADKAAEGAAAPHERWRLQEAAHKFAAHAYRFGRPIEAGVGLHKLVGIETEAELNKLRAAGESAIVEELTTGAAATKDLAGYSDAEWLHYVKEEVAEERKMPAGMPSAVLDEGHSAMVLDDFVAHPVAAAAGLKRAHVLALRLYTTSMHRSINRPLHEGCSPSRPHPYPATVALICDALQKLRSAAEQQARAARGRAAAAADVGAGAAEQDAAAVRTLWRGLGGPCNMEELKVRGCTELGLVSGSTIRAVAEERAAAVPPANGGDGAGAGDNDARPPTAILKLRADLNNGCDLSFLSVFPCESECVYPPATYLEYKSSWDDHAVLPSGEDLVVRIVEMVPRTGGSLV